MKRINLIPPEYAAGKKALIETGLLLQGLVAGAVLIVFLIVTFFVTWFGLLSVRHDVNQTRQRYSQAGNWSTEKETLKSTVQSQIDNVQKRIDETQKKYAKLKELQSGRVRWSEVLAEFNKSIPDKLWVDKLVIRRPDSQVIGGTYTNKKIGDFIENINKSHFFSNATFVRTESGRVNNKEVILFEVSFNFKG